MVLVFDRTVRETEVPTTDGSVLLLQDLYNESQEYLALSENMDLQVFIEGSGKQSLGGINSVGLTVELTLTWLLGFETRIGPAVIACLVNGGNLTANHTSSGTATAGGTTTLTDTTGTFARNGWQTGDVIRNVTDGSSATIVTVDSETVLTHTALTGGGSDDWQIGETWEVDSTHPFFPTANVHVAFAQDAAPIAIDTSQLVPDESHLAVSYVPGSSTVRMGVWLDRSGSTSLSPTSATVTWYNPDGTLLFSVTDTGPDAQGHFQIDQLQALADDTAYYADIAVTDSTGTLTTRRGVPTAGT